MRAQSCLALCAPTDCGHPGSSVLGIFQIRILEWVAISFSTIIADWNAKVESQEIPGVTGKFGLGVQNESGQRLTESCQENTLVLSDTPFLHWAS